MVGSTQSHAAGLPRVGTGSPRSVSRANDHAGVQQRSAEPDGPADEPPTDAWPHRWRSRSGAPRARQGLRRAATGSSSIECRDSHPAVQRLGNRRRRAVSNVSARVLTNRPGAGFLRCTLRRFFTSSPAFASAFSFSITCSGAWTTTYPPCRIRHARPDQRSGGTRGRLRTRWPVSVELGQLGEQHGADRHVDADAERVGAADHLRADPAGRGSRRAADSFGSMPAWCTPTPARTSLTGCWPNPAANRK